MKFREIVKNRDIDSARSSNDNVITGYQRWWRQKSEIIAEHGEYAQDELEETPEITGYENELGTLKIERRTNRETRD